MSYFVLNLKIYFRESYQTLLTLLKRGKINLPLWSMTYIRNKIKLSNWYKQWIEINKRIKMITVKMEVREELTNLLESFKLYKISNWDLKNRNNSVKIIQM